MSPARRLGYGVANAVGQIALDEAAPYIDAAVARAKPYAVEAATDGLLWFMGNLLRD